ncbi:MAG: conjugal transfer protein TraG N-terminal domain-containing protein [Patescibacteria group bacterium]
MHTFPIYTYGSGYLEWYLLSAVSALVYSPQFAMAAKIGALLAFVMAFVQSFSKRMMDAHIRIPSAFVVIALVYMVFIIPNVTVSIIDPVNPNVPNGGIVNKVPIGIAVPVSLTSQVGNALGTAIEQAFSLPNTLSYTASGLGLSLTMPNAAYSSQIGDPILMENYNQFFGNCVEPGIVTGNLSDTQIEMAGNATDGAAPNYSGLTSVGLWQYYGTYAEGAGANLLTTYYDESTTPVTKETITCSQAYNYVTSDLNNYVSGSLIPALAAASSTTTANYDQEFGLVNSNILSISQDAQNQLLQVLAVNSVSEAVSANAEASGANVNDLAYGASIAQQQQRSMWAMYALMVSRFLPAMYGVILGLISVGGVFLLMFLMFPFGYKYAQMYSSLLLWIVLWVPFAAVINYIIEVVMQEEGVNMIAGSGYSLASIGIVHNNYLIAMFGVGGILMSSIPLVTYYFATGSGYGLAMFTGSMDSSLGAGISSGANAMATGNVNMANDKFDNYMANNKMAAARLQQGDVPGVMYGAGGNSTTTSPFSEFGGGSNSHKDNYNNVSAAQENGRITGIDTGATGVNATAEKGIYAGVSEKLANAKADESVYAKNVISGATSALEARYGINSGNKGTQSDGLQGTAARKIANAIDKTAKEMGISKQEAMHEWMSEEGLKFNVKPLRGVGKLMGGKMPFAVAADLGVSAKQVSKSSLSNIHEKAFNDTLAKNLSDELSHTKGLKAEQWGGASTSLTHAYNAFQTANDSFLRSQKEVNSLTHDQSLLKKEGVSVTGSELIQYANNRGFNAKQTVDWINRMVNDKGSRERFMQFADKNANILAAEKNINAGGTKVAGPGSTQSSLNKLNNLNKKNDLWVNGHYVSLNGESYAQATNTINTALEPKIPLGKPISKAGHYSEMANKYKEILKDNPNLKQDNPEAYKIVKLEEAAYNSFANKAEKTVKSDGNHNVAVNAAVKTVTPKPPTSTSVNDNPENNSYNNNNGFIKTPPNVPTGAAYTPNNYTLPPGFNWHNNW